MTYAITVSDDKGPDCAVPLAPEMPETDPESTIKGWELVTTTWQVIGLEKEHDSRSAASYRVIGRFVWTWKAIHKGVSK